MEVYDDSNSVFDLPTQFDNSLDNKGFIELFSARSKSGMSNGVINKYTFSYDKTYLCVSSSGSQFRVIGRLFHSGDTYKPIKRCADFEVFKVGSLAECVDFWRNCVHTELLEHFII